MNANEVDKTVEMTIILFKVGEKLFGLSSADVVEVLPILELFDAGEPTTVYDALFNLRGEIIPALNLKRRFGADDGHFEIWNNILVVENAGVKYGLIVEKVLDVVTFDRSIKRAELHWTRLDRNEVFNWGHSVVAMLNLNDVLQMAKLVQSTEAV